jgi:hypothetical protein
MNVSLINYRWQFAASFINDDANELLPAKIRRQALSTCNDRREQFAFDATGN